MTVLLIPASYEQAPDDWLQVNWWNWRPTLELLRAHALLDADTIERMGINGTGIRVTAAEARQIAAFLEEYLRGLGPGDRVLWDLSVTNEPASFEPVREHPEQSYSATATWLRTFRDFCRVADGFEVS